jgi:uncharacterized RDD family membrane protein YckC
MNNLKRYPWKRTDLATAGRRYIGQCIDGLITIVIFLIVMYVIQFFKLEGKWIEILALAIPAAYFVLSDALPKGQSIGKKILKMAVIDKDSGKPCDLVQSLVRNILTPLIGIIDCIFIIFGNKQRLGDMMANTVVVSTK